MIWRYESVLGARGNLEIDLNYMFRVPLWPLIEKEPQLKTSHSFKIPILDIHELVVGKLSALFGRRVSRDFFDAHYLLKHAHFDVDKLRQTFVIYLGMTDVAIEDVTSDSVGYDLDDVRNKLFSVLMQNSVPRKRPLLESWAAQRLSELRDGLAAILSLHKDEVRPDLITDNKALREVVLTHPLIKWKARVI